MIDLEPRTLIYPGLILAACTILVVQLLAEARREDRAQARAAERAARPHSANVGSAAEDAAAILGQALEEESRRPCAHCRGPFRPHTHDDTRTAPYSHPKQVEQVCALPSFMACNCTHTDGCQHPAPAEEQRHA